ncbi:CRISPR system precrRNA processing endoribonuclease RAMP protein Cas6 [Pectinatus frisingensis]|uniref:CRISPR system precrRNA processing endoribonuclease RAMP protein Cas6 n=1 Tax=Pectinatus frisingensis TaxID=865 RepID=UPI0018C66082|nr:CRISPR system precrRNA processing endoribonuclease RAMP protein Cas6 [Pectinatus frisingensis]
MIKQYAFYITPLENNERIHFNMGSIMHGFLMESLPPATAQYLHSTDARPYSQHIQTENNIGIWQINALRNDIMGYIDGLIEDWDGHDIYLKQRDKKYHLQLFYVSPQYSYQKFSKYFFTDAEPGRSLNIRFAVPTSFKVYGKYQIFPDIRLILSSICKRWNALSDSVVFDDEQALADICSSTFIKNYHLSSMRFALEKVKITGFGGKIEIMITGPDMTARWINMLMAYGQFCGVGIKTALGMGAVKVQKRVCDKADSIKYVEMIK